MDVILLPDGTPVRETLVRAAEAAVLYAIRTAVYATDETGQASDPAVRKVIEDAIVEQVLAVAAQEAAAQAVRDSAALSPLGRPLQAASIDGASWTADQGAQTIPPGQRFLPGESLSVGAFEILLHGGLLSGTVWVHG